MLDRNDLTTIIITSEMTEWWRGKKVLDSYQYQQILQIAFWISDMKKLYEAISDSRYRVIVMI